MTIPDGTVLTPGETFTKTWRFQNTGSCTWSKNFSIAFVSGDDMDGSDTTIDENVAADKKAEISVELTAPDDEGTYTGYWALEDEYGNIFGETAYVEILVADATATSTPTATPTPTTTPTSTPTATYTPTQDASATETPTSTPVGTDTPTSTPTVTDTPSPTQPPDDTETPTNTPGG